MVGSVWRVASFVLLLTLGLIVSTGPASAADWVWFSDDVAGNHYQFDLDSFGVSDSMVRLWVEETFARPLKYNPIYFLAPVVSTRAMYAIDCSSRRYLTESTTKIDSKGASHPADDIQATDVPPGSMAEMIMLIGCRAAEARKIKPIVPDVAAVRWTSGAADSVADAWIRMDSVYKAGADNVTFLVLQSYKQKTGVERTPISFSVKMEIVSCKKKTVFDYAEDLYISKSFRLASFRGGQLDQTPKPIPANSYLGSRVDGLCAAAVPVPANGEDEQGGGLKPGEVSVGTAWATYKGYLVTASHVISGGSQIAVYRDGELLGKAKVVANDPASDIAVLKFIPDHPAPLDALRLAEGPSELGESVFTLGYPAPDLLGQQIKMTSGDVSSTAGINDNARLLQMSVPVQPGNSGGPVMGWDGAVIGVADASVPFIGDEALAQNVNYAVKSAYVRAMLEDLPDLGGYAYIKTAGGHDSLVAAARKAVFMLVVRQ